MMTNNIKIMTNSINLNRKQLEKLYEITQHFQEVEHFELKVDHSSGIGAGICVRFDLFDNKDTTVDITDVSKW
jgi:hypothetical protein